VSGLDPQIKKSFTLIEADWDVARANELLNHIRSTHIVIHRNDPVGRGRNLYYLFKTSEAERLIKNKAGNINLITALDLREGGATPTFSKHMTGLPSRGIIVDDERVVGFIDSAISKGITRGETRGMPEPEQLSPFYLSAEFPKEIEIEDIHSLLVSISSKKIGQAFQALPASVKKGSSVDIIVEAQEGFELQGKDEGSIIVGDDDESVPLQFKLRAVQLGTGKIRVYAFQNGQSIAIIKLESTIVQRNQAGSSSPRAKYELNLAPPLQGPIPDLSLMVFEEKINGDTALKFMLTAADHTLGLYCKRFGPVRLRANASQYFKTFFEDIEKMPVGTAQDRAVAEKHLAAKGITLFNTLIPEELQKLLWSLRNRIQSVHIQSEEPWIPWEILKLKGVEENGRIVEGPFMCEAFSVTRWIIGKGSPWPKLSAKKMALVVPSDSGLSYAASEKNQLLSLAQSKQKPVEVPAKFLALHEAFCAGEYDVWHFSGHGGFRDEDPNRSGILLEDSDKLSPENLSGEPENLGIAHPLVFLNACQVGRSAWSLTDIGGMASGFLYARAGAFIGAYWSVYDKAAHDFAIEFYKRLFAGTPIGKAVKEARLKVKNDSPGDPTWLAYVVFADPSAKMV
jgi:CHAT domain